MSRLVLAALGLQLTAALGAVGCGAVGALDGSSGVPDASVETSADVLADTSATAETRADTPELVSDAVPDVVDAAEPPDPHVCPTTSTPKDCSMGTGTGEGDQCKDPPCCYVTMVQKVIRDLVSSKPEWFDTTIGCPVIKDVNQFLNAVVDGIAAQGYCVIRDPNAPNEEITVKRDNAFSENFDIVASTGCARWGTPICTSYCAPAWW